MFRIARDLALPVEAVTETFAILAKRGKGKTNTAVVMAEEMVRAGHPVVVIDPVGVWWGLRSSADGKHDGLPVVIFGGDHADVPLEEGAGSLIADVVVDRRMSAVIDLSAFSKAASKRFCGPFLERLYQRNREPLHVIVDEADMLAPQRAQADGLRVLGAMEDLVRRGRARGLGVTLITQRPAVLHKDVLTQAEVLIALGMTGPRDVAAIDEWVRLHADEDDARDVKASLPSLPVGTAWVWSPGWLDTLVKVKVRARSTYDSSATPKAGQARRTPKRMAPVDLAALGEQIAATVAKAKDNDPRALQRRIIELQRELAEALAREPEPVEPERVEVPVLPADVIERFEAAAGGLTDALAQVEVNLSDAKARFEGSPPPKPAAPRPAARPVRQPVKPRPAEQPTTGTEDRALSKAERRILTVLAQQGTLGTTQVAIITGYSHKSGGFRNALSSLRSRGLIEGRGEVDITDTGLDALGHYDPLPTGPALLDWWREHHLSKAERAIVDVLAEANGGPVDVASIAERTGYSPSSGGFRNSLSRLRSLQLASGRGDLTLNDDLL